MAGAGLVWKRSLGLSGQHPPTATGDASGGAEPTVDCGTTSLLPGVGQGAVSSPLSPVAAIHRKGGSAAAASGLRQVPQSVGLKGA